MSGTLMTVFWWAPRTILTSKCLLDGEHLRLFFPSLPVTHTFEMSGEGNLSRHFVEPIGETSSNLGSGHPEGPQKPDKMGMAEVGLAGQDDISQGIETLHP